VYPVSLPALFDERYDGRRLRLGEVLVRTDAYTQRAVTYRGDGLTISGVMNIPDGRGPFPVLVLAHGYIDPAVYVTGQGLRREQDWLARAGYVVLHVDYRNHAGSDEDPRADIGLRLGYTADVINAVRAVRRSGLRFVDPERVGLLGRSMGGGVVYNVLAVAPGLVDAAVVFAPVSSRAGDNFNRWIRDDPGRSGLARRIIQTYGAPERRPEFWREASPRAYFDRVTEPLLIHHGTADESCPIRWSRASYAALRRAGVDTRLFVYPGEPHAFIDAWPTSMRRTVRFFERNLD
jgi:dipeptidyl aminopeptidase/acylaminoacyl peptidase